MGRQHGVGVFIDTKGRPYGGPVAFIERCCVECPCGLDVEFLDLAEF